MTESSFLQKSGGFGENQCFCCGNTGHHSGKCKFEDRPKNEWAVCKGTSQMHNMFGADVNNNNGQDDQVSVASANNNNNGSQNQNNNDSTPSQTSQEQSNLAQAQNSDGMAWTGFSRFQ